MGIGLEALGSSEESARSAMKRSANGLESMDSVFGRIPRIGTYERIKGCILCTE